MRHLEECKQLLTSEKVLTHFDQKLPIIVACDASQYGIGAVLSHRMPDVSEKPITFVSRTLTASEKNYLQIEKESLACVFGVKRFHSYIFGRTFELITDHKPLITLFNEKKPTPRHASCTSHTEMGTHLAAYEYTIKFRASGEHDNADALGRLPVNKHQDNKSSPLPPEYILLLNYMAEAPVLCSQIARWTKTDPLLSQVMHWVDHGWPQAVPTAQSWKPFWLWKLELSSLQGCLVWNNRVIVPPPGRVTILKELHKSHQGAVSMKKRARACIWWPGNDRSRHRRHDTEV